MMSNAHASHKYGPSGVTQMTSKTCEASSFLFVSSILTVLQGNADTRRERSRPDHRHDERHSHVSQPRSQRDDTDNEYNVLNRHHQHNKLPHPPSQHELQCSRDHWNGGTDEVNRESNSDLQSSQHNKAAEKHGFWPNAWKGFIDEAKLEWQIYLAARDAFPDRKRAKKILICDIIHQLIRRYLRQYICLEANMLPRHQESLYAMVTPPSRPSLCTLTIVDLP